MSGATLFAGLVLPWVLGIAVLAAARDASRPLDAPGEVAWLAGAGYLAGTILLTLWMRALSLAGVRFGVIAIGLPLVAATAALAWLALRRHGTSARAAAAAVRDALRPPPRIGGSTRALWYALLAWMAAHFALLAIEVSLRPLYPWEAWIEWATKARVWYETGRLAPFVGAAEWLAGSGNAWFDASPDNPATLPLLQAWACIALGRWDDVLMNWPWWQFAAALALVVYGGLVRLGVGPLGALLGAWFVASLPLANVHVALAGYADLPLAAFYAAGVLAFLHWQATRTWRDAAIALALVAACLLVKATGKLYVLTLLPAIAVVAAPRHGVRIVAGSIGAVCFALAVLAQTNFVLFGRPLHLDYAPAWSTPVDGFFVAGDWNLLWYGAIGATALAWRELRAPALLSIAAIVAAGLLVAGTLLVFPGVQAWMTDPPTFERATLHVAPLLVVYMIVAFATFARRWRETRAPAPTPAGTPESAAAAAPPAAD